MAMDERAELVEETIWEAFAAYRASPTAMVVDTGTIRLGITGVGYAGLNGVFRAREMTPAAVGETLRLFRQRGVSMLWHVGPQSDPDLEPLLLAAGLEFDEEEPGMLAGLGASTRAAAAPAGLRIEQVRDVDTLTRWVDVWSGGRLSEAAVRVRAALGLSESALCQHLIGYSGDEAIATAAVYHGARASEVQHVVTLDAYRRRGIGTAMTAAALELARRHGNRYAVLTSSPDGERLYARLGFVAVCSVRRFLQRRAP
jgi:GNAT superfamily N-acetyltransferase